MAKAEYSTDNIGHYGLAFEHYTHFTSPIRRYPDMMVHRSLQHYLDGGAALDTAELDGPCAHSSEREKRAAEAERASIKYKQVEFLDSSGPNSTGWSMAFPERRSTWSSTRTSARATSTSVSTDRFSVDPEQQCLVGLHTARSTWRCGPRGRARHVQRRELGSSGQLTTSYFRAVRRRAAMRS